MRKVELSKIYRLLYPSVPVVVAASHKGSCSAMPVVSIISLSNNPPLVGISSSESHATYRTIRRAGWFSVTWLDARFLPAIEYLGSNSGSRVRDKLAASGLQYSLHGTPEVPLLAEARAWLVCSVDGVRRYGDHELVIGRARNAEADDDFRSYWEFETYNPILYTGLGRPGFKRP